MKVETIEIPRFLGKPVAITRNDWGTSVLFEHGWIHNIGRENRQVFKFVREQYESN